MKRKSILVASICMLLMLCLGGCEDPTDGGGGSSNDDGGGDSSNDGGGASGLPVGIYTATATFGSTKKVVEVEIVSDNAITYRIDETEYTLTPYNGEGDGFYHPETIDKDASYFNYKSGSFGGISIGIKESSETSILVIYLNDNESSLEMQNATIFKEKIPPKLTLKERTGLYKVHLGGFNWIRLEFDAAGSVEYIQGINIFEGNFTVDELAEETGIGNSHRVQVTSTQSSSTKITLTIEFISDNQLSLRIGAQQELQTLTKE